MPASQSTYNPYAPQLESRVTQLDQKTGEYKYYRDSFVRATQESYNNPPSQHPDRFEQLLNVLPVTTGNLQRRWGYSVFSTAPTFVPRLAYEYQNDSLGARKLLFTSTQGVLSAEESGAVHNPTILTPGAGASVPRVVVSRDYAYISDGVAGDRIKWDGSASGGTSAWGADAPTTAPSIMSTVAGAVTLTQGRNYFTAFRNSTSGFTTDLSPASASSGPVAAKNINLQHTEMPSDAQLDRRLWLSTADAGDETTLYLLGDTPIATTTLVDDVTDDVLLTNQVFQETDDFGVLHGLADNGRPPSDGTFPIKHKGRLAMASGQFVYFSKSTDEVLTSSGVITSRYEECWPVAYQLDISEGAETVRGLLTDGDVLYIGTERHIRRITGSGPQDFSLPEIAFNNVGLLNQDVWRIIYEEGSPVGVMWLTPDFRLILSDFNTYKNVGTPIQDVLNTINPNAIDKCQAMFGSDGAYDLYMLAVPTGSNTECDTLIVYHVGTKAFFIWKLLASPTALLLNINSSGVTQWLFGAADNKVYKLDKTTLTDNGTGFTHSVRTSWLNLGDPTNRKLLNELELTGDPSMAISVEGASSSQDFASPKVIASAKPLVLSPFGQYKLYLAGYPSKWRYYRLTFTSTSPTVQSFIDAFALNVIPVNSL
jgi:hypothetical protein